jgi:hypothetical protein
MWLLSALVVFCAIGASHPHAGYAGPTSHQKRLVIYAVPKTAEFIDHADDRIRGMSANPFTPDKQALIKLKLIGASEAKDGPFPGDDVLYGYQLYATPRLKTRIGSAMYTCYYGFDKKATCSAYYQLEDGIVLGSGQISFKTAGYTLTVTGGTNGYLAATGEIVARLGKSSERLVFRLAG